MLINNKRGDLESIIFIVIFLAVIGFILFLVSHINQEIFTEISLNLEKNATSNYTESVAIMEEFKARDAVIWDYAFLGIFMGSIMAIGLSAYAIRVSPIFYWVYGLMALVVLATGVMLSNIWQDMATDAEFAATLSNFPITNILLGSYYPVAITAIVVISMIILFGKPPGNQGGFQ